MKPLIALTGSIGSGKSTVANLLAVRGGEVIDADLLAREVVEPGTAGLKEVVQRFGPEILNSASGLDRAKLGRLVFSDPEKRKILESILHPKIQALFLERLRAARAREDGRTFIVHAVPLFFEASIPRELYDLVVVVSASRETSLSRIAARDNLSVDEAIARYDSQMPIAEKEAKSDYIIKNNGSLEELEKAVDSFADKLPSLL